MNNQILVDTNILIYVVDEDSKFHDRAIDLILNSDYEFFTTSKNISEFLVALTRNTEIKIESDECLAILQDLLSEFQILYPNYKTFQKFEELIRKYRPRGLWIHDLEIASIAIAYEIPVIATNNIDDFKRIEEIEILSL